MLGGLLDLLLPPRCGGCGAVGSWLCRRCRRRIRRPAEPLCGRCGRELEFARSECGCRRSLRSLSRLRSACLYEGPLEHAIHRFKYEGWKALDRSLGGLLADACAVEVAPAALVVAVPLHPARARRRGYNQSELLARDLRRRFSLGAPEGALVRTRDTPPQVGLDRVRRRLNVADAFAWSGPPLRGAPVLLVDDVATTGSTLEECARALRLAGSGSVTGLTLARVRL